MPRAGANIRAYHWPPPFNDPENTKRLDDHVAAKCVAQNARSTDARSTAATVVSCTKQNRRPTLARHASTTTSAESDSTAAAALRSGDGPCSITGLIVSCANVSGPWGSTATTTGPIPSPSISVRGTRSRGALRETRIAAVPIVGCPANCTSVAGVKIRTRASSPGRSGGSTNVVSGKLNSRASRCMAFADSPSASGKTVSWFPVHGRRVKTSARTKARFNGTRAPTPDRHEWSSRQASRRLGPSARHTEGDRSATNGRATSRRPRFGLPPPTPADTNGPTR